MKYDYNIQSHPFSGGSRHFSRGPQPYGGIAWANL